MAKLCVQNIRTPSMKVWQIIERIQGKDTNIQHLKIDKEITTTEKIRKQNGGIIFFQLLVS